MSTGKTGSYPWYPRDYLADTVPLSLEEHGAYRLLLDHQWLQGRVPTEPGELSRLLRVSQAKAGRLWAVIGRYFPGGVNARLERVRGEQNERIAAASNRGKAGAAERERRRKLREAEAELEMNSSTTQGHASVAVAVSVTGEEAVASSDGLPDDVREALVPYTRPAPFPRAITAAVAKLLNPAASPHFTAAEVVQALGEMQAQGRSFDGGRLARWCANNRKRPPVEVVLETDDCGVMCRWRVEPDGTKTKLGVAA